MAKRWGLWVVWLLALGSVSCSSDVGKDNRCLSNLECPGGRCIGGTCQFSPANNDDNNNDQNNDNNDNNDVDPNNQINNDSEPCPEGQARCGDGDGCVDVSSDVARCGGCEPCAELSNASVQCVEGQCVWACDDGFVDLNADTDTEPPPGNNGPLADGCECQVSAEVCDGLDNDCDGLLDAQDDGLSLEGCAERPGAESVSCRSGVCVYECLEGLVDTNGDLNSADNSDGCECQLTEQVEEVCDGIDNDCDGLVDAEDNSLVAPQCGVQQGVCAGLSAVCEGGLLVGCGPDEFALHSEDFERLAPGLEVVCDGLDGNCDGAVDENCCEAQEARASVGAVLSQGAAQIVPVLAANGDQSRFLVAWQEALGPNIDAATGNGSVRYSVYGVDGLSLLRDIQDTASSPNQALQPAVAFDGVYFLLVWAELGNATFGAPDAVKWRRVDDQGVLIDQGTLLSAGGLAPRDVVATAAGDGSVAVAWVQGDCEGAPEVESCVWGTRVGSHLGQEGQDGVFLVRPRQISGADTVMAGAISLDFDAEAGGLAVWTDRQVNDPGLRQVRLTPELGLQGDVRTVDGVAQHALGVSPDGVRLLIYRGDEQTGPWTAQSFTSRGVELGQPVELDDFEAESGQLVPWEDGFLWLHVHRRAPLVQDVAVQRLGPDGRVQSERLALFENVIVPGYKVLAAAALEGFGALWGVSQGGQRAEVTLQTINGDGDFICQGR